tara:strand:- start:533 stop:1309 length:777 start_codon:yes stop_codon:yes gene_type:complete
MKAETKLIKEKIWSFEEMYDRVKVLKDKFKGETAYICTAGPTFNTFSEELLKEKLNDKLVISIKQTQDKLKELTDIHLLNFCNLSNYEYPNPNTIVAWAVWDNNQPKTIIENFPVDFILDTFKLNDGSPNIENTIAATEQWDQMDINNNFARPWGPGTMYEMAIPMALYMGCSKIITIGWDLFKNTLNSPENRKDDWCYQGITHESTKTQGSIKELEIVKDSTKGLYEWLLKKEVELVIVDPDGDNPAYKKIKRIKTI